MSYTKWLENKMRVLESERLIIKPMEPQDLEYQLNLRWDKDITEYLIHDPISFKNQSDWYNNLKKTDLACSIFLKVKPEEGSLKIIGNVGLFDTNYRHQRAGIRARIDPEYQRKGIATEAMVMMMDYGYNTLNLNKITADSFCENEPIVKLITKMGFTKEGILEKHFFHNGKFRDAYQLGFLRENFNAIYHKK
jgi:[ribosomal protein S5]-alanine N-acetyltransferase